MHELLFSNLKLAFDTHFEARQYFAVAYGSSAYGAAHAKSDLDIFIATESPNQHDRAVLTDLIIEAHTSHNLGLDDEVPYENKLVVSFDDVAQAIALTPFPSTENGRFVPPVVKSEEFLSSHPVRLRLLLNALTTPHLLIGGDEAIYAEFKAGAENAIVTLGTELSNSSSPSNEDILQVLLVGSRGESGEEYLGYKRDRAQIMDYLSELISRVRVAT